MAEISIKVLDQSGKTLAVSRGENEANLVYSAEYQEGDRIIVDTFDKNDHYWIQVDDALGQALLFLKEGTFSYPIPFGSKRINLSPKAFSGSKHLLHVRKARPFEYLAYRNLSKMSMTIMTISMPFRMPQPMSKPGANRCLRP